MKMVWIIIASSLIVAGLVVFVVAISAYNFNFLQMINSQYEINTYVIDEKFDSFSINVDTTDVTILPSNDGACRVVCQEKPKVKHSVEVNDGALSISMVDSRRWYEYIEISGSGTSVTIYLPKTDYKTFVLNTHTGNVALTSGFKFESIEIKGSTADVDCKASSMGLLKITAGTGDIELENISAGEIELSVSTGDIEAENVSCVGNARIYVSTGEIELRNMRCKDFISEGSSGDTLLSNVTADEKISVTRGTGDIKLENSDAKEFCLKSSTGDITGSLRSNKIFVAETSTGKINVPESLTGGKFKATTATGNIIISIKK